MNKLKNDLNCDKNKDAGVKGKRRTKKYKSMIKKKKNMNVKNIQIMEK